MGTGRTAGAKSIVESGVIWQLHSFVMGHSGEPKMGPSSFCDAFCLIWNDAHTKEMPQATCSNLGIFDGEKYLPEPDCVECVKDLIRFLRCKPAGKVMRLKAQTQDVVTSHFWITRKHWYKYCTQERRWKSLRASGSWVTWRSQERPCSYPQVFFVVEIL